jgi:hypothetical protein
MMHPIYTVGYGAGWTPAQLAIELERLDAELWDIRYRPTSRQPAWTQAELQALLGPRYRHEAGLGNVNYQGGPIVLAHPAQALPCARDTLRQRPIMLLCQCPNALTCHRSSAATFLAEQLGGVKVIHLEAPAPSPAGLRAVSLQQPMGWAIFYARPLKDVENRDTLVIPRSFRGRIAIHASAKTPLHIFRDYAQKILEVADVLPVAYAAHLAYGAILGTVEVVDCVTVHLSPWFVGQHGYVLANPRPLAEPIPCKGALGFWSVPAAAAAQIATLEARYA